MLFGPVWSRRFGWSLGVNQFPEKMCTYACPYCQLGPGRVTVERVRLCDPERLLEELKGVKGHYDVITFVPEGEPLLDLRLGECSKAAREFSGKKTVLLTNASLLYDPEVARNAYPFDVVSIKVDAGNERTWKRINAPHEALNFDEVIEGILKFSKTFEHEIVTETMVVKGYNDSKEELREIAEIIKEIGPKVAFIMVPTRPPTIPVEPGDVELALKVFKEIIGENVVPVTQRSFASYPKDEKSLAEIAKVHPVPKRLFSEVPKGCSVITYMGEEFVRC